MTIAQYTTTTVLVNFTDTNGTPVDPDTVELLVADPTGSVTTYTTSTGVTKRSVGAYGMDLVVDQGGRWTWEWRGDGTTASVATGMIDVEASEFPAG